MNNDTQSSLWLLAMTDTGMQVFSIFDPPNASFSQVAPRILSGMQSACSLNEQIATNLSSFNAQIVTQSLTIGLEIFLIAVKSQSSTSELQAALDRISDCCYLITGPQTLHNLSTQISATKKKLRSAFPLFQRILFHINHTYLISYNLPQLSLVSEILSNLIANFFMSLPSVCQMCAIYANSTFISTSNRWDSYLTSKDVLLIQLLLESLIPTTLCEIPIFISSQQWTPFRLVVITTSRNPFIRLVFILQNDCKMYLIEIKQHMLSFEDQMKSIVKEFSSNDLNIPLKNNNIVGYIFKTSKFYSKYILNPQLNEEKNYEIRYQIMKQSIKHMSLMKCKGDFMLRYNDYYFYSSQLNQYNICILYNKYANIDYISSSTNHLLHEMIEISQFQPHNIILSRMNKLY